MPISAKRFVRKMRGCSQAHLLEASDDSYYVVKFRNNPEQTRLLINEVIASAILKHLEIETPETELILITPEFLVASPEVFLTSQDGRRPVLPGLHFASRFPGNPKIDAVFDFVPDVLLRKCRNLPDYIGTFVFDTWVANTDVRQSIFYLPRGVRPVRQYYLTQMIDNGGVFDGPNWRYKDSPIKAYYFRPQVYSNIKRIDDFEPWLDRVRHFPVEVLDDALRQIPPSWIGDDRNALDDLLERLCARRERVVDLIHTACRSRQSLFSNWAGRPTRCPVDASGSRRCFLESEANVGRAS